MPASDCVILDTWYTSGLRGTGSTDYTMDGVFVADNCVTRHSLQEPSLLPDRRYDYPAFNVPMLSAVALGAARGAVDSLTELFGGKVDRRNQRPVAGAYDKQADLGMATATVDSARAYLYDTTARAWELTIAGEELPRELRAGMRLACTHAVAASVQASRPRPLGGGRQLHLFGLAAGPVFPRRPQRGRPRIRATDHHGRRRPAAAGPGAGLPGELRAGRGVGSPAIPSKVIRIPSP